MAQPLSRWMDTLPRRSNRWAWARRGLMLFVMVSVVSVAIGACGADRETLDPPGSTGGGGAGGGTATGGGPCADGEARECHVTIGRHEGVLTCLDGVETCEGGSWGECVGVTQNKRIRAPGTRRPAPGERPLADEKPGDGELPKPMSLSGSAPCSANPCDPTCQSFDEDPGPGGVTIPTVLPMFPWTVGDINALPDDVAKLGTQEPCSTAEDCQFDQYCDNPSSIACDHHPCATGTSQTLGMPPEAVPGATGLNATCSPCVQKICDADPTCCTEEYPGPCEHDPCLRGSPLKPTCDACVAAVCAPGVAPGCCEPMCTTGADCTAIGMPAVCNAQGRCACNAGSCPVGASCNSGFCVPSWGKANCVNKIAAACAPKVCPTPNKWTAACADKVASLCGSSCEATTGTCAHNICYTGDKLALGCDSCVDAICAVDPNCCTGLNGAWNFSCVEKVKSVCGQNCAPKGLCTSWLPGETDPKCPGADLTLGVPCDGHMPVCNRGTAAIPAGQTLDVISFPAGAGKMPSSDPNEVLSSCSPGAGTLSCSVTLAQPLAPGECLDVTTCSGLADGMELMVNPAGANHVNECQCANNWTIWLTEPCTSPACVASANVQFVRDVTMYISVDTSGSQVSSLTTNPCPVVNTTNKASRWDPMTTALKAFFGSPDSAGLGVVLRFWPERADMTRFCNDTLPDSTPACPVSPSASCGVPHVDYGILSADPAPMDAHEAALVAAVNARQACFGTPMRPALEGAESWAVAHKQANPDQEVVVVLITDGLPNECGSDSFALAAVAADAYYNHNVRTYVIGFGSTTGVLLNQIAAAGGGAAFSLTAAAGPGGLQDTLVGAMNAIRGDFLPCDIAIPIDGVMDPTKVSLVYTTGAGVDTTLTKVANPAACGTGWYIDPANPANAKLCPATCTAIQADKGAKVQAVVPCQTTFTPITYTETYESTCPAGTKTQWGYFTYDTATPTDSNVVFSVRSADTEAGLASATTHLVATAHSTPTDTQVCDASTACQIDLYTELGGLPDARRDWLEVIMELNPSMDGTLAPAVNNWQITFSCPDAE